MISNEKVINYKVADLFKYYNFLLDHISIGDHLKKKFKLFVVTLG